MRLWVNTWHPIHTHTHAHAHAYTHHYLYVPTKALTACWGLHFVITLISVIHSRVTHPSERSPVPLEITADKVH